MVGLDVLRAIAVLLVLGRHVPSPLAGWSAPGERAMAAWIEGGWVGVDLFFVLSGFLVSGLLFGEYRRHGSVSVGRFLARRALKIYPAFYAFILLTLAIRVVLESAREVDATALAAEVFFVQNYVRGLWSHTWSLAVEEHFYLLCAALVFVLTRTGKRAANPFQPIPWAFTLVAVACLIGRILTAKVLPLERPYAPTHLRIDGLMFGVLLSYIWHHHRETVERVVRGRELMLSSMGVALLVPAFLHDLRTTPSIHTYGFTAFYVASGLLVLGAVVGGIPNVAPTRVLAKIGRYSYSIYLWHIWVLDWSTRFFDARSPLGAVTYMVASIFVGIVMAKLVEIPVLAARDRMLPSRTGSTPLPLGSAVATSPSGPGGADAALGSNDTSGASA
jgi:peptidoglycan/LPS O-acetylase OafA/YrhL